MNENTYTRVLISKSGDVLVYVGAATPVYVVRRERVSNTFARVASSAPGMIRSLCAAEIFDLLLQEWPAFGLIRSLPPPIPTDALAIELIQPNGMRTAIVDDPRTLDQHDWFIAHGFDLIVAPQGALLAPESSFRNDQALAATVAHWHEALAQHGHCLLPYDEQAWTDAKALYWAHVASKRAPSTDQSITRGRPLTLGASISSPPD